jgi:hypothetical protein
MVMMLMALSGQARKPTFQSQAPKVIQNGRRATGSIRGQMQSYKPRQNNTKAEKCRVLSRLQLWKRGQLNYCDKCSGGHRGKIPFQKIDCHSVRMRLSESVNGRQSKHLSREETAC